jgi:catechol 2,3-dioxygenase-like lactoylglutathione lyase family enzyme
MSVDLFAGMPVSDFAAAKGWYEKLLGGEPAFTPHATEAVWELAEHRYLFIVEDERRAGTAIPTVFVEDLDALLAAIAKRGLEPAEVETYSNGVRKAIFRDPDGNELGYGGPPAD